MEVKYKEFVDGEFIGDGEIPAEITDAEHSYYEEKAKSLATSLNVSAVHPVVFTEPDTLKRSVCYLKEPVFLTKVAVLNKATMLGPWPAALELMEISIIKEASDAITFSESPESDRYRLGIGDYCMGMITRLQNQFKKK